MLANVGHRRPACARQQMHRCAMLVCAMLCFIGCRRFAPLPFQPNFGPPPIEVDVSNPTNIGPIDPNFLWKMIVDAVDDHFRIDTEQPVRRSDAGFMEGKLTTFPEISGTSLEPWRRDTARGFERLQSTVQTIRRTCTVRVLSEPTGYQITVEVIKEQEDVDQSQFAASGAAAQRHDGSIVRNENQLRQLPLTLGWYEIGRDLDLERRIMEGILGRIVLDK